MFWIRFGVIVGSLAAAFISGWITNGWRHEAERAAEVKSYADALKQGMKRDLDGNAALAAELNNLRQARAADKRDFDRRLKNAKGRLVYVECPVAHGAVGAARDSAPVPDVRLTPDAVRLWNDALGSDGGIGRADDRGRGANRSRWRADDRGGPTKPVGERDGLERDAGPPRRIPAVGL